MTRTEAHELFEQHLADVRDASTAQDNEKTIFEATECASANDALETAAATGQNAVILKGRFFAIAQDQCDKLAAAGEYFAYICNDNGKTVTIPVN